MAADNWGSHFHGVVHSRLLLCLRNIVIHFNAHQPTRRQKVLPFLWSTVCLLMVILGINKQLDLQSLFTEVGRQVARAQGWMDQRGIVQFWFIVAFGTTAMGGFLSFAIIKRDLFRRFMLAFAGLFFLLGFIVIRAASFHHFDVMLGFRLFGARMNWVLELTGIYLIIGAGFQEIIILEVINSVRRKALDESNKAQSA